MRILYHYKKKLNECLKNKEYLSSTFNNCINFKLHKKIYNQYIIYWAKIIDKNKN